MRNVFAPAAPSSSQGSDVGQALPSVASDEQLLSLRAQYLALQTEYRDLSDSCRDTDLLLKDMRTTLFTLRVGAQAFDEPQIHPEEVLANITQNRENLQKMCSEANGKTRKDRIVRIFPFRLYPVFHVVSQEFCRVSGSLKRKTTQQKVAMSHLVSNTIHFVFKDENFSLRQSLF